MFYVFVAPSTGYGKSACFQSLPLIYDQLLPKCEPANIVVVVLHYQSQRDVPQNCNEMFDSQLILAYTSMMT